MAGGAAFGVELAGARSLAVFRGSEGLVHFLSDDLDSFSPSHRVAPIASPKPKGAPSMTWFYEIRSSTNAVLKRDGGFPTQDAAKIAAREDAKRMKSSRQPDRPDVGRILVRQKCGEGNAVLNPALLRRAPPLNASLVFPPDFVTYFVT
jgi:hypothetical protein